MPVARKLWKALGYAPHPKQLEFHTSDARFKVAVAGRRFGKSRMAAADVEPDMMDADKPTRGWIVAPQYKLGEKEFRYLWDDLVIKLGLGPVIKKKAYNMRTGEMYIEMPWGSRVDVMSGEHPDGLVGEGLDWVIFSEAAKLHPTIWEKYVSPSLADRQGRAIFPSTPEGFNWYYDLYRRGQSDDRDWASWRYPSWENKYVYPGGFDDPEIQRQLITPDDPWFWQEIGADFRAVVGLVYPEWDDSVNIQHWDYDPSLPNYLGADFGFTNSTAFLDVQVTPSDELRVWREYYKQGLSPEEHAVALKARHNPVGYQINGAFGDAADPAAVRTYSRDLTPMIAMGDAKGWLEGVQSVKGFLARKGGLLVDPSCENFINEINGYMIKTPSTHADPRDNVREEPQKRNDHCFAGDTMVLTYKGERRIADIRVGERVLTRQGWKRVIGSGLTQTAVEVYNLGGLIGTGNHPIFTENRGWVALDSLRYGDILQTCPAQTTIEPQETYGENKLGRSLRDRISIMSIKTALTTDLRTLNALLLKNTEPDIKEDLLVLNGWSILQPSGLMPLNGTEVLKGLNGIVNTGLNRGRIESFRKLAVSSAISPSKPLSQRELSSAAITANQNIVGVKERITNPVYVKSARRHSFVIDTLPHGIALTPALVGCVPEPCGTADVYNLTIEDCPEYFADHILVHNCMDALRYLCMHLFVLGADSHIDAEMLLSGQVESVFGDGYSDMAGMPGGIFTMRDMGL